MSKKESVYESMKNGNYRDAKNLMITGIKGIGTYELVSKTGMLITLGLCYKFKPTQTLMKTTFGKILDTGLNKYAPKIANYIKTGADKFSNWMATNKYTKKIPETLQLKSKRFGKASAETFVIYHAMVPFYAWLTYKIFDKPH